MQDISLTGILLFLVSSDPTRAALLAVYLYREAGQPFGPNVSGLVDWIGGQETLPESARLMLQTLFFQVDPGQPVAEFLGETR